MFSHEYLKSIDPELSFYMEQELGRQRDHIELIASENFVSPAVMAAMGSHLTNKYAEGYPAKRYYGGCEFVDEVERLAIRRAKSLFHAEHANVQPHSGVQANMAAYAALVQIGDTILAMDLAHGGHLSHGSPVSESGRKYNFIAYGVKRETETIDYEALEALAKEHRPKLIVAGASAYPRLIDFRRISGIAQEVGAYFMVDMAHIAGLVAAGEHPSPIPYADVVTSTTHKTLRGPRGGLILCKEALRSQIDRAVFPGMQGGPLMHVIAAKALCFGEALTPEFKAYQQQVRKNASALAAGLTKNGLRLVAGGTDTHLMLADLTETGMTGNDAQMLLDRANITANRNAIPFEKRSKFLASGVRFGTPAVTTRGMRETEMTQIADLIGQLLREGDRAVSTVQNAVLGLCEQFPLYE